ncbi:MAG TPA: oxidoreductase family protein [Acidimicrobiales bacterium]
MRSTIPVKPGDLTPAWLSDALRTDVRSVEIEEIGEGKGILAVVLRLHLDADDVPPTLVAKLPSPHAENYNLAVAYGFYRREVEFYRHIAGHLDVATPSCHYADVDDDGTNFVLLIDEVTGFRQPDQIEGVGIDDARVVVDTLAALHAHWWKNPALDQLHWLPKLDNPLYRAIEGALQQVFPLFEQMWGEQVAPEGLATARRQIHVLNAMIDDWVVSKPETLTHYDVRADNLLFGGSAGDGVLTLLDWQLCLRMMGAIDISYFLGTNLTIENRRAHETELLRRYHDRITAFGVRDYSYQRLEDDYAAAYLNVTNMTLYAAVLDPGNDRGRALMHALITRSFQAAADVGTHQFLPA